MANPQASFEEIVAACKAAEIHDVIEKLPQGYQTPLGEHGIGLSGGQRQRIAIARALYKGSPLLVLDEATNALDPDTEARVLANLFADAGRTVLIIAHRASAMKHCDRIIRLSHGRIAGES
jgi:ABC-type bacteriocin/lantibiotic exporter with double-glycine peptidase domain